MCLLLCHSEEIAKLYSKECRYKGGQRIGAISAIKSLLMRVEVDSEKANLKLNIQKAKIMASGLITSWQIDGERVETWQILLT